jgi:hypothetical protein
LTKALQVSESEMMGLLEKEYTLKLSGRLGLPSETRAHAHGEPHENGIRNGAVIIPISQSHVSGAPCHLAVSGHDFEFIQNLYEAYKHADPKTRQTFVSVCQSVLNLRSNLGTASVASAVQGAPAASVALGGGERPQG